MNTMMNELAALGVARKTYPVTRKILWDNVGKRVTVNATIKYIAKHGALDLTDVTINNLDGTINHLWVGQNGTPNIDGKHQVGDTVEFTAIIKTYTSNGKFKVGVEVA